MIRNPIIQRELLGLMRRRAIAIALIGAAALLAGLVVALWPTDATVSRSGVQARQLFRVFAYGLLICLLLIVPAFPAVAIVSERQNRTLGLLLTSPLSPLAILLGKISAAVGLVLLVLLLSLPASTACFVMGGVDLGPILRLYGVLALAALQFAMIGLLVSCHARSTDSALRTTYGLTLLVAVVVLGPYQLMQGRLAGPLAELLNWLYCFSPIPAVVALAGEGQIAAQGVQATFDPVARFAVLAVAVVLVCAGLVYRRLGPGLIERSRAAGTATEERSASARLFRRILYLGLFDPQRRSRAIGRFVNPVMVKEFRTRVFGRLHWMMRLIGLCLIVSLALCLVAAQWAASRPEQLGYLGGVLVIFQMALVILITPALSAGLISIELESGGWALLRTTRLTARQIVLGKLASAAFTVLILLLATVPGYAVLLLIDPGYSDRVVAVLISLGLTALFSLLLAATCSAWVGRTALATTLAYLIIVLLCVATLVPWMGEGTLFGRALVERILTVNPLAAALAAMRMPGFAAYNLIPLNWQLLAGGAAACLIALWLRTWQLTRPD